MSDIDLSAIRARVEKATPGPWGVAFGHPAELEEGCRCMSCYVPATHWLTTNAIACEETTNDCTRTDCEAEGYPYLDAEFIAHARTDVPGLLAEVERLRALLPEPATCARSHCDRPVDSAIDPDLCPPCREAVEHLPSWGRL